MSMRERQRATNTLVCLLQGLKGEYTHVELRNENAVWGQIDYVDGYMNMEMSNVTFTHASGSVSKFTSFFVQGKQIRFVHVPDHLDIEEVIKGQLGMTSIVRSRANKDRKPRVPRVSKKEKKEKMKQLLRDKEREMRELIQKMTTQNARPDVETKC